MTDPVGGEVLQRLRKEAKRWLKAIQSGDEVALQRFRAVFPRHLGEPQLREIQQALARERGFSSWTDLKSDAERRAVADADADADAKVDQLTEEFLRRACLSYGLDDWPDNWRRAERIRVARPEIATASIHTAVVCGEREYVKTLLDGDATLAARKGGPQGWEPLLFLCYGRLPNDRARSESLAVAKLLLDRGADPNARWISSEGPCVFTALAGAMGQGELGQPEHPQAEALARLLLDRGADPNQGQGLYNTQFVGDDTRWLDLLFAYGLGARDPINWSPGVEPAGAILDYLLVAAVSRGQGKRIASLLDRGADPNARSTYDGKTCYQHALLTGRADVATRLLDRGARRETLSARDAFVAACMRLDRSEAQELLDGHREFLDVVDPLTDAAGNGNTAAVRLFLDLGMDPNREGKHGHRALNVCADRDTAEALLAHGADPRGLCYGATAANWNATGNRFEMARFLAEQSRTLLDAVISGHVTLARELIASDPSCVGERTPRGNTALHLLPEDPALARALAHLLLAAGADAAATNEKGQTPKERLVERGLDEVADLLPAGAGAPQGRP
jgi:ankyrin repeat protein